MRNRFLPALLLGLAATSAIAKTPPKKKKTGTYNAAEFIKKKEGKTPVGGAQGKATGTNAALAKYDCQQAGSSPTAPQGMTDKPVDEKKADDSQANTTQQALEMAKTVVKTVKENCRAEKPSGTIEPDVGVQVVKPGDLGAKESKGERPELSGTVGVSATF